MEITRAGGDSQAPILQICGWPSHKDQYPLAQPTRKRAKAVRKLKRKRGNLSWLDNEKEHTTNRKDELSIRLTYLKNAHKW